MAGIILLKEPLSTSGEIDFVRRNMIPVSEFFKRYNIYDHALIFLPKSRLSGPKVEHFWALSNFYTEVSVNLFTGVGFLWSQFPSQNHRSRWYTLECFLILNFFVLLHSAYYFFNIKVLAFGLDLTYFRPQLILVIRLKQCATSYMIYLFSSIML